MAMKHTLICARTVAGGGKVEGPATLVTMPVDGFKITMVPVGDSRLVGLVRKPGETDAQLDERARGRVSKVVEL